MKYYRLSKGSEVKYAAIPSEFWLPVVEYVCFHPDYYGTVECQEFLFGLIADADDFPDWDFSGLPEVQYDTCVELTQKEYQKLTGGIEKTDYYLRNADEPYYMGEMPEDWFETSQVVLLGVSHWNDHFGWEDDYAKVVDGQIDNENVFYTMLDLMQGVDPVLELESYDRWIYAHALESMGKAELISYRK